MMKYENLPSAVVSWSVDSLTNFFSAVFASLHGSKIVVNQSLLQKSTNMMIFLPNCFKILIEYFFQKGSGVTALLIFLLVDLLSGQAHKLLFLFIHFFRYYTNFISTFEMYNTPVHTNVYTNSCFEYTYTHYLKKRLCKVLK